MGGPDTSRGINFQYACAIGLIVDFPHHPDWHMIQMEGEEDIEDVQVFDQENKVMFRAQIKQKRDPNQWRPHELRDVLLAFSKCPDSDGTLYQFIYAGSEGETVYRKLRPILHKLQYEGQEALAQSEVETLNDVFDNTEVVEFLLRVEGRLSLVKREAWKNIEAQDLRRLRRLLAQGRSSPLQEEYEQVVYNDLFREIAQKTEESTKYFRRLTRKEIYKLLQIEESVLAQSALDIRRYIQWVKARAQELTPIIPLTLQEEPSAPDILSLVVRVESESELAKSNGPLLIDSALSLLDVVGRHQQVTLVGESGSGKTVSLLQLALHQCNSLQETPLQGNQDAAIPVFVDLAGYGGEPVTELIRESFHVAGQMITDSGVDKLAREGRLQLLFDDFDAAKVEFLPDLLLRLKRWSAAHPKCTMMVTTHRPSDGHKLGLPTFRLLPLNREQAQRILLGLPDIDHKDASVIWNALPAESRHLTTSPLTLRMLAYTYIHSDHQVPRSRSPLYQEVINGIFALSERKGFIEFDRSDKLNLLALLARWMQDNETYRVSSARLSFLMNSWIVDDNDNLPLTHLQSCDQLRLRSEFVQSGLLRITMDGDVEFVHPTFRAYLAALTISVDELDVLLDKNSWRTSLPLWASLRARRETDALVDLLVEHPLLLGRVVRERRERREQIALSEAQLQTYFEQLNQLFQRFMKQFPVFLRDAPWESLTEAGLTLLVIPSSVTGFTLAWQSSETGTISTQWTNSEQLQTIAENVGDGLPWPVFLLPMEILQRYHPLEVVYLWIVRSLFDLLVFVSLEGGIDTTILGRQTDSHPAIALVVNRFVLYRALANGLPTELRAHLPFYATQGYDLAVEVLDYLDFPTVRFAVVPSQESENISVFASILQKTNDTALFERDEDGNWCFQAARTVRIVSAVEQVSAGELMKEPPGFTAQKWLKADLESHLPGFPPQPW